MQRRLDTESARKGAEAVASVNIVNILSCFILYTL